MRLIVRCVIFRATVIGFSSVAMIAVAQTGDAFPRFQLSSCSDGQQRQVDLFSRLFKGKACSQLADTSRNIPVESQYWKNDLSDNDYRELIMKDEQLEPQLGTTFFYGGIGVAHQSNFETTIRSNEQETEASGLTLPTLPGYTTK